MSAIWAGRPAAVALLLAHAAPDVIAAVRASAPDSAPPSSRSAAIPSAAKARSRAKKPFGERNFTPAEEGFDLAKRMLCARESDGLTAIHMVGHAMQDLEAALDSQCQFISQWDSLKEMRAAANQEGGPGWSEADTERFVENLPDGGSDDERSISVIHSHVKACGEILAAALGTTMEAIVADPDAALDEATKRTAGAGPRVDYGAGFTPASSAAGKGKKKGESPATAGASPAPPLYVGGVLPVAQWLSFVSNPARRLIAARAGLKGEALAAAVARGRSSVAGGGGRGNVAAGAGAGAVAGSNATPSLGSRAAGARPLVPPSSSVRRYAIQATTPGGAGRPSVRPWDNPPAAAAAGGGVVGGGGEGMDASGIFRSSALGASSAAPGAFARRLEEEARAQGVDAGSGGSPPTLRKRGGLPSLSAAPAPAPAPAPAAAPTAAAAAAAAAPRRQIAASAPAPAGAVMPGGGGGGAGGGEGEGAWGIAGLRGEAAAGGGGGGPAGPWALVPVAYIVLLAVSHNYGWTW